MDTLRHLGLLDAGDEPHRALTTITLQDIDPQGTLRAPPKTRFSSAAQSRRYGDGTDVDFGDAAGDDGGGDVFDTCGSAGGSAPSLVDAGRGTTLSRRRLVGAKRPCRALIHHLAVRNQGHELVEHLDAGHHQLPAAVRERAFHVHTRERVEHRYW